MPFRRLYASIYRFQVN